jgi:hypothetical protein
MGKIDPKKEGGGSKLHAGEKLMAPVGHFRGNSSKKGTPFLAVMWMCLADHEEESQDVGATFVDYFYLVDSIMWKVANMALAMNWDEMFDPDDDEDIEQIFAQEPGGCLIEIELERWEGRSKPVASEYAKYEGEWDAEWDDKISEGEGRFAKYLAKVREKAQDSRMSRSQNESAERNAGKQYEEADDDIPF